MSLIKADRVLETTTTTGTGAVTLAGAVTGYRAFSSVCSTSDTCYYAIFEVDANGNPSGAWETGLGTYSGANTLTRTTVFASSNSNAAVSFAAGTKQVGMVPVAGGPPFSWIGTDGSPTFTYIASPSTPAADSLTFAPQRIAASGGSVLPRWLDEGGSFYTSQIHLARNDVFILVGHNNQVGVDYLGHNPTVLGTMTARAVATTNRATRTRRTSWVSSATAGNMAGLHQGPNHSNTTGSGTANDGSGFMFISRFVVGDTVAGAHMFIGMGAQTPAATTDPSTITNCIGIAQINGSANLKLVYGGSAAQTAIDLGANFPANTSGADVYELTLCSPANVNGKVSIRLERVGSANVYTNTITAGTPGTQLPSSTTWIGFKLYRSNNATAAAVTLDISTIYTQANI